MRFYETPDNGHLTQQERLLPSPGSDSSHSHAQMDLNTNTSVCEQTFDSINEEFVNNDRYRNEGASSIDEHQGRLPELQIKGLATAKTPFDNCWRKRELSLTPSKWKS